MSERAIVLANDLLRDVHAKTAHGLIRGPSRWPMVGVIDATCAGADAGEVLDGVARAVPVFASVRAALDGAAAGATHCVLGVATSGGVIPKAMRGDLLEAARAGLTLVSGLHHLLSDDDELRREVERSGGALIDLRRPRPVSELRFWTGDVLALATPRVAVLGTDCALGKRTTCQLLLDAARRDGLRAEMVYTGQTGWLTGLEHGFILDATPNDFVTGELERAVLACAHDMEPDVILLEGQSGLRNPSGPCGAELITSMGAAGVVLQHAPGRRTFQGLEHLGVKIPPLHEEIELIRLLGAEVWAVTLNEEGLDLGSLDRVRGALQTELGLPVLLPLRDDLEALAALLRSRLDPPGPS